MRFDQEKQFLENTDAYRHATKIVDTAETLKNDAKFREKMQRLLHLPKFRELSKDKLDNLLSTCLRDHHPPSFIVNLVEHVTQEHLATLAHQQFRSQLRRLKVGHSDAFVTTTGKKIIITKTKTEAKVQLLDGLVVILHKRADKDDLFFERFESGPHSIIDVLVNGKPVLEKTALNRLDLFVGNRNETSNGFHVTGKINGFQADLLLSRIRRLADKQELTRVLPNRLRLTVRREGYHYKIETSANVSFTLKSNQELLALTITRFSRGDIHDLIKLATRKIYFYNNQQARNSENIQIAVDCLHKNIEPRIHTLVVGKNQKGG